MSDQKLNQAKNDAQHVVSAAEAARHQLQESAHRLRQVRVALNEQEKLRGLSDYAAKAEQILEKALDDLREVANMVDKVHKGIE